MLKFAHKCFAIGVVLTAPFVFCGCDRRVTTEKTKEVTTTTDPGRDGTVVKKEETTTTTQTP